MDDIHPLLSKFERTLALSAAERSAVAALPVKFETVKAEHTIGWEGTRLTRCLLIVEGVTCCSKTVVNDKLQITNFHVAGDMPDLMSLHLTVLDSDMWTISPCRLAFVDHSDLRQLCEEHPRLTASLWRTTLTEAAIYREWVINVGQRSVTSRLAHLLCEMMTRLNAVDLVTDGSCLWSLSSHNLADATGLSVEDVDLGLTRLARQGLLMFAHGRLVVRDWDALVKLAGFRTNYLHLLPKPGQPAPASVPPSAPSDDTPTRH